MAKTLMGWDMELIRTAARALLIQNDHILAVKYADNETIFYALPGGGQRKGEPLLKSLQRECLEELGIEVNIGELIFVHEWIDEEKDVHQIEFIFECFPRGKITNIISEVPDGNQIGIEWLPISGIVNFRIYPLEMREELLKLAKGKINVPVYLGYGK